MAKIFTIAREYPKKVRILHGAPVALVSRRASHGKKGKYETNREIKYWSTWFLLKSLTTSGFIQDWPDQQKFILGWCQMGFKTFRAHLNWLIQQRLAVVDANNSNSFRLCSFDEAAEILDIEFTGTYEVPFNPKKNKRATQTFQYILRLEEIEYHKEAQIAAIIRKLDINPALKQNVVDHLTQLGVDRERLVADPAYFVRRLLVLQARLFRQGSDLFSYFMQVRADVNRGVVRIKRHHGYRSKQSVSYFKRKMVEFGFAQIEKQATESRARTRLYVPANEETPDGKVRTDGTTEGYIWNDRHKTTIWRLCDQIKRKYPVKQRLHYPKTNAYAA